MQRRKLNAILYAAQNFVIDQDGMGETLAAVDDAMAHGIDIRNASDFADAGILRASPAQYQIDSRARVPERSRRSLRRAPFSAERNNRLAADALDQAAREPPVAILRDALQIRFDQLKLNRRAAAIKDENDHKRTVISDE
jgi:hypothetical protein